jgi:hypothetical protein
MNTENSGNIIIYDPEKSIPKFNDDKTRMFSPKDGRDGILIFIPDNSRNPDL